MPRRKTLWTYNDGGRAAAGFKGEAGDCVTRAIAIATQQDYRTVYDALFDSMRASRLRSPRGQRRNSPRDGVPRPLIHTYLAGLGWIWIPCMKIGQGCRVHVRSDELPGGRLILSLSKHIAAFIDGMLHDTADCSRGGRRCVYGYWAAPDEHHESGRASEL